MCFHDHSGIRSFDVIGPRQVPKVGVGRFPDGHTILCVTSFLCTAGLT